MYVYIKHQLTAALSSATVPPPCANLVRCNPKRQGACSNFKKIAGNVKNMMQMQPLSLYASNDDGLVQCGTSANISCTVIAKLDTLVGNNGQQLGVVSEISAMSASNELPSGRGVYPVHNACDAGGLHGAACCMVQGNYMTNPILFALSCSLACNFCVLV